MSSLAAVGADGYYHAVDDSRRRQRRAGDGAGGKAKGGGTFTMKATCCGATFVVRTDPQSAGFVFVSGGRFRHTRRNAPVRAEEGDYWAGTDERAAERAERERAQLRQGRREGERTTGGDAMATLERAQEDERIAKAATKRMDELYSAAVPFGDDYASNAALRRDMRARRKAEKALESEGRQMGVGVPLGRGTAKDVARSAVLDAIRKARRAT
eukprot:PRCOL_00003282-RA